MENKSSLIKKLLIAFALTFLILFCISQKHAGALVIKNSQQIHYVDNNDRTTQTINSATTTSTSVEFPLTQPLTTSYDLVGFNMARFGIHLTLGSGNYSQESCTINYANGQQVGYTCSGGSSLEKIVADYVGGSEYFHVYGFVRYSDGTQGTCYRSTEYENYIMCPTNGSSIISFVWRLNTALTTQFTGIYFHVTMNDEVLLFNYDSTDIINGLGNITTQQQQTNQAITNSDTTGAGTGAVSDFTNGSTGLNTDLDNAVGVNSFTTIFTNFFTQIENSTCTPLTLPIPYTNENLVLPCLGTEFENRIPVLWTLYVTIITGVIVLKFWRHYIDMFKHLLDPYSTGLHDVGDITGGGK